MDDDFSSYKDIEEIENERIEAAKEITKNQKIIQYHYNEDLEDKIFIEIKESYELQDCDGFKQSLINAIEFIKNHDIYNETFFIECNIPNILKETLSEAHSLFEEPEKLAYLIIKLIETILSSQKSSLKDFFTNNDFFLLFINVFTNCSLYLQLILVPIIYSIANDHNEYIDYLLQQNVDLLYIQKLILSPNKNVQPKDRYNCLCLSLLIIFTSLQSLNKEDVLSFLSNIIGKLEYQSNHLILNCLYFLSKDENYVKDICISEVFFNFIIESLSSKNQEIKSVAIQTLTNFYSHPECDQSFDFQMIEEITHEKSDISLLAYDLLIALSSNPNCTDELITNGIFSLI